MAKKAEQLNSTTTLQDNNLVLDIKVPENCESKTPLIAAGENLAFLVRYPGRELYLLLDEKKYCNMAWFFNLRQTLSVIHGLFDIWPKDATLTPATPTPLDVSQYLHQGGDEDSTFDPNN